MAIAGGLFHPNCKHRAMTYYGDDIANDQPLEKEHTAAETELAQLHKQIQQQKRIAAGSIEKSKINKAQNNVDQLEKQAAALNLSSAVGSTNTKQVFTDAKTMEEAQTYAKQFIGTGYSKTFKNEADYNGISLDHANEINRTMEELYSKYDMSKINGIKAISPTSALGKKFFK